MLRVSKLSFPGFGIGEFDIDSVAFTIGKTDIAWYAVIITIGIILAVSYLIYRAKQVGIKMNFEAQGINKEEWMNSVEKMSYLAYEDQCSPANPRVPIVEDIKNILIEAFDSKEFM